MQRDGHNAQTGFVPTMGALHAGHLSLLRRAQEDDQLTIVSIFVNPAQFNDPADLARYPRTLDSDLDMLYADGCDVVFAPGTEEIYPVGETQEAIPLNGLDERMEGIFRPGHFTGVARVVRRLLDLVKPQRLYMGQKDFQQFAIVHSMIHALGYPVSLIMCPTVREPDGLAMSSRNLFLEGEMRTRAPEIYRTLLYAAGSYTRGSREEMERQCLQKLTEAGLQPEYFEIVDGETLQPASAESQYVVACCAVRAGDVRLIDNVIVRGNTQGT